jgi:hypothetical protein
MTLKRRDGPALPIDESPMSRGSTPQEIDIIMPEAKSDRGGACEGAQYR